jgi:CheY-like chemotaxis protein
VLLDHQMPGMDGLMVAREIARQPWARHTRVVLMTSLGEIGLRAEFESAGVEAFLTKPVKFSHLRRLLASGAAPVAPAVAAAATAPATEPAPLPLSNPVPLVAARRLLIAEDNEINQKVVRLQLRKLGCESVAVNNGREALRVLGQDTAFDLVLMDCQMPELDGYDATRLIRALPGEVAQIPIVAMTAHAMTGDREKCLEAGMDDYLSKPVRESDLVAALERWHIVSPQRGTRVAS